MSDEKKVTTTTKDLGEAKHDKIIRTEEAHDAAHKG
jgi:hypothetical protein